MGRRFIAAVLVLSAGSPASAPSDEPLNLREREVGVMGTSLKITVLGEDSAFLESAMDAAVAEMQRVEDLLTDWRASPLMELNEAAGMGPREVAREMAVVISRALAVSDLTGGAFDPTFAAVGKLWDFKKEPPVLPDESAIREALRSVGASRVNVNPEKHTVELPEGMRIGLGGIGKGYGVDRAMMVLRDRGVMHARINAGGDLKVLGKKHGEPWEVAIKHPRDQERALAVIRISNSCVVTSGDYERFFVHEGKRYHHILDPRTGRPATGCMSATVVAQNAEYADALATALCVLGPKESLELVERLPRVEALLVDLQGEVHVSSGLRGSPDIELQVSSPPAP